MTESNPIKFTFIGSVDSGKSTASGQILNKANYLDTRELQKIFDKAGEDKMDKWKWARILDIFDEEAAKGKTHESINIQFEYNNTYYELIDTPGHKLFIRSMIEGVYGANIGCVIIPMINNEFEACMSSKGTLKEHLIIAKGNNIQKIILVGNKMDLIDWNENEFNKKCDTVQRIVKSLGYKEEDVTRVPISAWEGKGLWDTIGIPSWYNGRSLLDEMAQYTINNIEQKEFTGQKFILDTRLICCSNIITISYECIFHACGEEYLAKLIGVRNGDKHYITNGKSVTVWELQEPATIKTNMFVIRKDTDTLGVGIIVKCV